MKRVTHSLNLKRYLIVCFLITFITKFSFAQFEEQNGIVLTRVDYSSVAWGDYNNDGYLDILLTGTGDNCSVSKIYKNNGNGNFSELVNTNFVGINQGSAIWNDYNNDGFLDIILTGITDSLGFVSKVYRNNKDDTFTEQAEIQIPGLAFCSVARGDYNNDTFSDILLAGSESDTDISHIVTKIYKNNGDSTFTEQTSALLAEVWESSVAWGDYNNDGYLDILLAGFKGNLPVTKIYKNNGDGTFTEQTGISLIGVGSGSVTWGDYNNDGFLDILITGFTGIYGESPSVSKIYKNNGDGSFTLTDIPLVGVSRRSSASWGDYNNDGYLDILLCGCTDSLIQVDSVTKRLERVSKVYKNNGDETFTEQNFSLPGVGWGSSAWGDYNRDGLLDILLTGDSDTVAIAKVYKNIGSYPANTPPTAPTELQDSVIVNRKFSMPLIGNYDNDIISNSIILKWKNANDVQTQQKGLTYNIRIGTTPGVMNILSPMSSLDNGTRNKPAAGNAGLKTNGYIINDLKDGTYYWSVQAVDNSFVGGNWAVEKKVNVINTSTGKSINSSSIKIYPNPAKDFIQILRVKDEPCFVNIIDMNGLCVLNKHITGKEEKINLQTLHDGLYMVILLTPDKVYVFKILLVK